MSKNYIVKQCIDCGKVFRTDNDGVTVCPTCQRYRKPARPVKKIKRKPLSISEVLHIGAVYDKVNGTSLRNHYGEINTMLEKCVAGRCVCCGDPIPEGTLVCQICERKANLL